MLRPSVCASVRLSDTRVNQSKTVEVRIMQFSPHSSPTASSFCEISFIQKLWLPLSGDFKQRWAGEKHALCVNISKRHEIVQSYY